MKSIHVRIALALGAAATLLATSTSGSAAWRAAGSGVAPTPSLGIGPTTVLVTPAGGPPRPVDPTAPTTLGLGDVVTVRFPVTIHSTESASTLSVRPGTAKGDAALSHEVTVAPSTLSVRPVDGGPELAPSPHDQMSRLVDASADGHTYLVEWTMSTRTTRDGKAAGADNRWGDGPGSLQGARLEPRRIEVRLVTGSTPTPSDAATGAS